MSDRRFPICGTIVPPLLGRAALMQRILRSLTKSAPDHLQLVGARFAGKTVLLTEVARHLRVTSQPYTGVFVWDLGHQTPANDEAFMYGMMRELAKALGARHAVYARHLQ